MTVRHRAFDKRFTAEITALVLAALGLFTLAYLFYTWDREFLDTATVTPAVVTDKSSRRDSSGTSDSFSVSYRWVVEGAREHNGRMIDETWSGSGAWSGGKDRWRDLEPGESTVEIAWRYSDEGRSTESRLLEHGFVGVPWPMLIIGVILIGVAAGRVIWRVRQRGANDL